MWDNAETCCPLKQNVEVSLKKKLRFFCGKYGANVNRSDKPENMLITIDKFVDDVHIESPQSSCVGNPLYSSERRMKELNHSK